MSVCDPIDENAGEKHVELPRINVGAEHARTLPAFEYVAKYGEKLIIAEDTGHLSPFGDKAPAAITHISAGFGLSFVECEPGKGVLMHNHETVETFMCLEGVWRIDWEGDEERDSVDLNPFDFFACPIGVNRRFQCVQPAAGKDVGLLLGIIEGDAPGAQFSSASWERINEFEALQHA